MTQAVHLVTRSARTCTHGFSKLTLAARAELALAMGEAERAQAIRAELKQIPLSAEDQARFRHELQAADDLERWLTQQGGGLDEGQSDRL